MGRRKQTTLFEAIGAVSARLPWWACAAGAILSYLVLHSLASRPLVPVASAAGVGQHVVGAVWRSLAQFGQYLVPGMLVLGGMVSIWRRRERAELLQQVRTAPAADALNGLSWQEFERIVGEIFRKRGYTVEEHGGGGADGGVDLVLRKDGEKSLVQCKQWRATKVGVTR